MVGRPQLMAYVVSSPPTRTAALKKEKGPGKRGREEGERGFPRPWKWASCQARGELAARPRRPPHPSPTLLVAAVAVSSPLSSPLLLLLLLLAVLGLIRPRRRCWWWRWQ